MSLPDLSRREELVELMDRTDGLRPGELDGALATLAVVNRWLGGYRLVFGELAGWLKGWPKDRPVTILDVGTGGADLPVALCRWGRGRGLSIVVTGLDQDPEVAALARKNSARELGVSIVEDSLEGFAAAGRRFDFVIASLMLHHVPDGCLVRALRALDALAERGVIVSDLRRCAAGYLGVVAATALLGDRVSRHDGPVSVRRGFTAEELDALALGAGLPYLRARPRAPFRLSLAGEKHRG
jgi:SAM-dependent methyltransferase